MPPTETLDPACRSGDLETFGRDVGFGCDHTLHAAAGTVVNCRHFPCAAERASSGNWILEHAHLLTRVGCSGPQMENGDPSWL